MYISLHLWFEFTLSFKILRNYGGDSSPWDSSYQRIPSSILSPQFLKTLLPKDASTSPGCFPAAAIVETMILIGIWRRISSGFSKSFSLLKKCSKPKNTIVFSVLAFRWMDLSSMCRISFYVENWNKYLVGGINTIVGEPMLWFRNVWNPGKMTIFTRIMCPYNSWLVWILLTSWFPFRGYFSPKIIFLSSRSGT